MVAEERCTTPAATRGKESWTYLVTNPVTRELEEQYMILEAMMGQRQCTIRVVMTGRE